MANTFAHVELQTQDLEQAKAFYQRLFDWTFQEIPKMSYTLFNMGEGTSGGMMKNPAPNSPSSWLAYVEVADIAASTDKAKALGATVVYDVTEVPGYG